MSRLIPDWETLPASKEEADRRRVIFNIEGAYNRMVSGDTDKAMTWLLSALENLGIKPQFDDLGRIK